MAMLISKFHRLIQSRLLWGVFAVLIILSFVVWGSAPYWARQGGSGGTKVAGRLNGKKVTEDDIRTARAHVEMAYSLATMQSPRGLPAARVREAAVHRLAVLAEARKMGFQVGDADVEAQIRQIPLFQQNGQFNPTAYAGFIRNFVQDKVGASEQFFLQHIREELLISRVRMTAAEAVIVPLADADRVFSMLNDEFMTQYAVLGLPLVEKATSVSEADLSAFFARDPARYTLPEKVELEYVVFPVSQFQTNLPVVADSDAEDYYLDHRDDYIEMVPEPVSNQVAGVSATNAPTLRPRTRPFEEVKGDVVQRLLKGIAMDRAEVAAARMVGLVAGDSGKPVSFADAAASTGVPVRKIPAFARDEAVADVETTPEFLEAAFALNSNPGENFSTAIRGRTGVYVLNLVRRIPPRVPELSEVRDRVRAEATEEAKTKALRMKADALRAAGPRFEAVAAGLGVKVEKAGPFTLSAGLPDHPIGRDILSAVVYGNPGETMEPRGMADGSILVVRVTDRKHGEAKDRAVRTSELARMLAGERQRDVVAVWEDDLVRRVWASDEKPLPDPGEEETPAGEDKG